MPHRLLAAKLGVHPRTAQEQILALEKAGELGVRRVRITPRRNGPNVYTFPKLQGFISDGPHGENTVEKLETSEIKATTPARENPRAAIEARRAQDREDHHRMRERYEAAGREWMEAKTKAREENRRWWREGERHRWDGGRSHRLARAQERTRMAMQAMVGVNTAPIQPMSEVERLEYKAEMAALDARQAERLAAGVRR